MKTNLFPQWMSLSTGLSFSIMLAAALNAAQVVTPPDLSRNHAAGGNGDSSLPLITPDGRFVLFASTADNLVGGNTNIPLPATLPPRLNVFLRDRGSNTTALVSGNPAGQASRSGDSIPAGISTNGLFALFETSANDLLDGDTNGASDVLVRDMIAGVNILASVATNGAPGNGDSRSAVMTPDGRFVAFISAANNLVTGDSNGVPDVFVRDLWTGTTTLASLTTATNAAGSEAPEITPDGKYVAFYLNETNRSTRQWSGSDIYVCDLVGGTTIWASSYARTAQGTNSVACVSHLISADGKFVAYEVLPTSLATCGTVLRYSLETGLTDIVSTKGAIMYGAFEDIRTLALSPDGQFIAFLANPNGIPGLSACVYVWDAASGTTTLASGDLTGAAVTNSLSRWPAIATNGNIVAFQSTAIGLVTNLLSGEFHAYVRDLQAGVTTLIDVDTNGIGSGVTPMTLPRLTDDGHVVAFETTDASLVPDDSNKALDVFARDWVGGATTDLISRHDPALPSITASGPSSLSFFSASAEGSFVAFASEADDLVPNDTNGYRDVFVRDLLADRSLLVSVDAAGAASGNGISSEPSIAADGRYVAFSSTATNLVGGDTNKLQDVFVRDLLTETTSLVSVNANGMSGNRASYSPTLNAYGNAILFHSQAGDLAPGPGITYDNLFWRDLTQNVTYRVSSNTISSTIGDIPAAMTPDGHYIALGGPTSNLYLWDSQLRANIYSAASLGGVLTRIAVSADGNRIAYTAGTGIYLVDRAAGTTTKLGLVRSSAAVGPRFSADSHYLAYVTTSPNVVSDTNGLYDVYLYDCQTSSNVLVSQAFNAPVPGNGDSDSPDISPDGRFVAYRSAASNLVPNDSNGVPDVFLWDRVTGTTILLSANLLANSTADNRSLTPVFSGDGTTLVFESWAGDIIPQDYNRASDLFVVNLLSSGSIPLFRASILPATGPAQGVWLSWPASERKTYRVQFKDTLADPNWQELGGGVIIIGTQGYLNDPSGADSQRFYRIVAQ